MATWICNRHLKWRQEPRACYTEWSKSEEEKQTLRINTYIWNLERWYWQTYTQGRSRDTDVENRLVDTAGERESRTNREHRHIYSQFSSVAQSCPTLVTPWTVAHQASLSITNFQSLPKLMSITISSSVVPFFSCSQSFSASGPFQMSQLFASGGQSIGASVSTSVLPIVFRVDFL